MKIKFADWLAEVESQLRDKDIGEVEYDRELAKRYFRDGYPPKEFVKEHILAFDEDVDFDPRYEM